MENKSECKGENSCLKAWLYITPPSQVSMVCFGFQSTSGRNFRKVSPCGDNVAQLEILCLKLPASQLSSSESTTRQAKGLPTSVSLSTHSLALSSAIWQNDRQCRANTSSLQATHLLPVRSIEFSSMSQAAADESHGPDLFHCKRQDQIQEHFKLSRNFRLKKLHSLMFPYLSQACEKWKWKMEMNCEKCMPFKIAFTFVFFLKKHMHFIRALQSIV